MINNSKQKILYGAGGVGKMMFEYYTEKHQNSIYCFADTFKGGTTYCGKPVLTFEKFAVIQNDYDVVICVLDSNEVIDILKKAGINKYTVWSDAILQDIDIDTDDNLQKAKKLVAFANNRAYSIIKQKNLSMLRPEEITLNYLLARYYFIGVGHIFDAGICSGGCTESFISGLLKNPNIDKIDKYIYAYELAKYDNQYNTSYPRCIVDFVKRQYSETINYDGKDFSDLVRENIAHLDGVERIKLFIGNIIEQEYPDDIEIMFLDVCKSPELNFSMQKLYSRMIPGCSLLIHQDYIHPCLPYIKVTMGYLAEYFEYIGSTRINSAVWLLKKKIPQEVLEINPYSFCFDEVLSLHNKWNYVFNEEQKAIIMESIKLIPEFNG
ncbi:MAG: hypothetical protein LBC87_09375 [Fibromonadaceae bacterium]|jgi:hypothetical protein|nr:hypothetical protein [Fibromonadaceae bacterium]